MKEQFYLRELSVNDGVEVYDMLQRIGRCENEFKNTANGLSVEQFGEWLQEQSNWAKGIDLPERFVPQTTYWLFVNNIPVGIGKIRHRLNRQSRMAGGNIGYAVDPMVRGKGYGKILLHCLIEKAKEMQLEEILLSVEKRNPASKRVIEYNGGRLISENEYRWFFTI